MNNSFEQKIKERNNLLKSQVESLTGRSPIREVVETLLKAGVAEEDMVEKAKYVRREGAPGNYKYIYEEPKGKSGKKEEDHDFSHFTDMKKWNKLAKDPANHMTPYDKNKPVVPTQHAAGQVVREALQKENKTDKVDKNKEGIQVGQRINFPSDFHNKTLAGRSADVKKINGDKVHLHMHDNDDIERNWLPVPISHLTQIDKNEDRAIKELKAKG